MKKNQDVTENWNWPLRIALSFFFAFITIVAVCILMWMADQKDGLPGLTFIWLTITLLGITSVTSCYIVEDPKKIITIYLEKSRAWFDQTQTKNNLSRIRHKKTEERRGKQ